VSSIEGASLFDIVVVEKGCAGGGFGLVLAGLDLSALRVLWIEDAGFGGFPGAIWGLGWVWCLRDESA